MFDRTEVAGRFTQAFNEMINKFAFYVVITLQLPRVEDLTHPTGWTDGLTIGYNPEWVATLTRQELVGFLCHEVLHIALLHPWRRLGRDIRIWNQACDHVVNGMLIDCGVLLPPGALAAIRGRTAEQIYDDLLDAKTKSQSQPEPGQPQQGAGAGKPQPGAGGKPGQQPGPGAAEPGMWGEVRDAGSGQMSEAELAQSEANARVLVQQAVFTAKGQGTMPAALARLIEQTLQPRIPWKEIIGRFVEGQCKQDYSWMRPNECYLAQGIIYPGLYSPAQAVLAMAGDSSGSMWCDGGKDMKEVCSEVMGALELYQDNGQPVELEFLWCDTVVHPQVLTGPDDLCRPVGGGGTRFSPVFKYVEDNGMNPRGLIYLTDGECTDFGTAPAYPVLWVLTRRGNTSFRPPFGEVVWTMNGYRESV